MVYVYGSLYIYIDTYQIIDTDIDIVMGIYTERYDPTSYLPDSCYTVGPQSLRMLWSIIPQMAIVHIPEIDVNGNASLYIYISLDILYI